MSATEILATVAAAARPVAPPTLGGGRVTAFDGSVIEAEGLACEAGALARIGLAGGLAEVTGFRHDRALLMGLDRLPDIAPGTMVRLAARVRTAQTGPELLGRVIDGHGRAADAGPPVVTRAKRLLDPPPLDPATRARVTEAMPSGVRLIDALLTLGRGQRVGVMAGSGVGKSVLLGQIARHAKADVTIVALIGERGREIADFIDTELAGPARQRIVTIAVPADAPPLLRITGARRALAIAEQVRADGGHALVILDSLTRIVHAQREVALARGEAAGAGGLPGSALALIAGLVERAGGDRAGGGAISLIATVLADADNMNDPIVDAARGVLDGRIVLDRSLAARGVYPAIDIAASISRTMADCAMPDHLSAAVRVRRMVALIEANRDLVLMGAYPPAATRRLTPRWPGKRRSRCSGCRAAPRWPTGRRRWSPCRIWRHERADDGAAGSSAPGAGPVGIGGTGSSDARGCSQSGVGGPRGCTACRCPRCCGPDCRGRSRGWSDGARAAARDRWPHRRAPDRT